MGKLKEQAVAKVEADDKRPQFIARARQAPGSDFFITIGAAWETRVNGKLAYSVKLSNLPLNWDGSFLLLEPLPDKG